MVRAIQDFTNESGEQKFVPLPIEIENTICRRPQFTAGRQYQKDDLRLDALNRGQTDRIDRTY